MTILALDVMGTPRQWISEESAISYHATNSVAWSLGSVVARYRGGIQKDGSMSYIESTSIIAIRGQGFNPHKHSRVVLSNKTLFGRDKHICAYCGKHFPNFHDLSRDHIIPRSKGGENTWLNSVTACKMCNSKKSNKNLKDAGLELLYVPYEPSHHENMILQNRNVLSDQMEYLMAGIPKHSRIWLN